MISLGAFMKLIANVGFLIFFIGLCYGFVDVIALLVTRNKEVKALVIKYLKIVFLSFLVTAVACLLWWNFDKPSFDLADICPWIINNDWQGILSSALTFILFRIICHIREIHIEKKRDISTNKQKTMTIPVPDDSKTIMIEPSDSSISESSFLYEMYLKLPKDEYGPNEK